ncbi:roadblock/LC7 domain-containing protein [Myxococcota bacterium]|nr:roadblock/LC7 domain-containing protein [Myxococcota bacterium]MBU1382596.1 roadblock/LC7 domain-containing protein [Myxococcota bacterium]MBU1495813.1 roadblock/LC7 domain-containing protein [Myxococcota bacterium]
MSNVKMILNEILKTDGIHEALIVGRDGFVIEATGNMEADMLGVAVSTVIGSIESMGNNTNQGKLFEVMAEYDQGTIIVAPVGRDAVLGVTAKGGANLGAVRFAVKKNIRELERVL